MAKKRIPRSITIIITEYCTKNNIHDWISVKAFSDLTTALQGKHDLIFFPFFLHRLGDRAGELLSRCLQLKCHIAIADYRTPERNLDYPSYLFHYFLEMGGGHFGAYRAFMRSGGLEYALYHTRQIPHVREVMLGGAASFVCLLPTCTERS